MTTVPAFSSLHDDLNMLPIHSAQKENNNPVGVALRHLHLLSDE